LRSKDKTKGFEERELEVESKRVEERERVEV
jgi:hypothetical protein